MSTNLGGDKQKDSFDLSVVILSAGADVQMALRCVSTALLACRRLSGPTEILFIDNASESRVGEIVAERFPSIYVLRFSERVGFCTANNAAFRMSCGKYIVQLNDDTVIDAGTFRELKLFLDEHPCAGAVGPRLETPTGSLQIGYYARRLPTLCDTVFHLFGVNKLWPANPINRRHLLLDDEDQTRQVEQPAGAALTYRREALFGISLLDENFTFAFDDVDVCRRLMDAGWNIWYDRDARVTHFGAVSLSGTQPTLGLYTLNGMMCYWAKHGSRYDYAIVRVVMITALMLRCLIGLLEMPVGRTKFPIRAYARFARLVLTSFTNAYTPQTLPSSIPTLLRREIPQVSHG